MALSGDNISIIGFMGAGKSTVGRLVSRYLSVPFIDLDEEVEKEAGMSVPEIFSREGESGFRSREARALRGALKKGGVVIACGGGIVKSDSNIRLLKEKSVTFLLQISVEEALRRIMHDDRERPLLSSEDPEGSARRIMDERKASYAAAAHEVIDAGGSSPEEVAKEIVRKWKRYR